MNQNYRYLDFIRFKALSNWGVLNHQQTEFGYNCRFPLVKIGTFLHPIQEDVIIKDSTEYKQITVRTSGRGVVLRGTKLGKDIGTKKQWIARKGEFILSKIDARNGAMGIVPDDLDGAIVTHDFPLFEVDSQKIIPQFLLLVTTTHKFVEFAQTCSSGTTNRQRINVSKFLNTEIPLPHIEEQQTLVDKYIDNIDRIDSLKLRVEELEASTDQYIISELGLQKREKENSHHLSFVKFSVIKEWGYNKITNLDNQLSSKYTLVSISKLSEESLRGGSPKYDINGEFRILNQKCVRWNSIDQSFMKQVNNEWFLSLDRSRFTMEGDILVNSTGDGTLGRTSVVRKGDVGLFYDSHVLLLRLNNNVIPEYVSYYLNSSIGQQEILNHRSAEATKQTELGVNNLGLVTIPLPPLEKQKEIAETITNNIEEKDTLKNVMNKLKVEAIESFGASIFEQ